MIKAIISDLSNILFIKDSSIQSTLNTYYDTLTDTQKNNLFEIFRLDNDHLSFLKEISEKHGISMYLFTSGHIQENKILNEELNKYFKRKFSPEFDYQEGIFGKDFSGSYTAIAKILNINVAEVLFIDDNKSFVEAAKNVGAKGIVYSTLSEAKIQIEQLLKLV